ncbi:MAG: hypothetical protein GVY36_12800 [Verrucomicrobia bacterium]|jgi:Cu2+-exporting ATPase|nr:hypothetical protein [Verrucomicrobiota bacterium]
MAHLCRHCSTPFSEDSGVDGFCCGGCREVYHLIREEGLGDYYRKQDRMAEPLKDRVLSPVDHVALLETQRRIEASDGPARATFNVSGMSCMGCVWLIERLAERQMGSVQRQVSLTRQTLALTWSPGQFDLGSLAEELRRFGYRLDARPLPVSERPRLSPLALRTLLALVFTGNALLIAVYSEVAPTAALAELLSLACLCFTALLGAAPFFQSVYRAAQIRRWHSDLIPALCIVTALVFLTVRSIAGDLPPSWAAFAACLIITILVSARFVSAHLARGAT